MRENDERDIEGLPAAGLMRAAIGATGDPEAEQQAASQEQRVRAEIEKQLPELELLELLGRGGMGYVYRAHQSRLGRDVALKVVAPDAARQTDFAERFAREAQALARLSHPNIVAVHDYGQEGAFCWLVMEYVDGSNLGDVLRAGSLEPAEALALVPKICDALQYAHDQGVVHRDVKPENILLDAKGGLKIADFGLAKLSGSSAVPPNLTHSKQVLGTLRYMAPEQLDRPLEVDHRADIYSLGVVFYEMLTGEIPMGRFDPPSRHSATSEAVDEVVLRALAKEPARRYQSASAVKADLVAREHAARVASEAAQADRVAVAPRVSARAAVAAGVFAVGLGPYVTLFIGLQLTASHNMVSLAQLISLSVGLLGLALVVVSGFLGFRALRELRRDWPSRYGVGAALVSAWGGLLVTLNVITIMTARNLNWRAFPGVENAQAYVSAGLWLVLLDALVLLWLRRRFLAQCQASAG